MGSQVFFKPNFFQLIWAPDGQQGRGRSLSENNLALVLVGVVVIHFLCHIPRVIIAVAAQGANSIAKNFA